MGEVRKITIEVPSELLAQAQEVTGKGITETVREGLRRLNAVRAQHEFRKLRGTLKPSIGLEEMREDRELWPPPIPRR